MTKETNYDGVTVVSHGMPDPALIQLAVTQLMKKKGEKKDAKDAA